MLKRNHITEENIDLVANWLDKNVVFTRLNNEQVKNGYFSKAFNEYVMNSEKVVLQIKKEIKEYLKNHNSLKYTETNSDGEKKEIILTSNNTVIEKITKDGFETETVLSYNEKTVPMIMKMKYSKGELISYIKNNMDWISKNGCDSEHLMETGKSMKSIDVLNHLSRLDLEFVLAGTSALYKYTKDNRLYGHMPVMPNGKFEDPRFEQAEILGKHYRNMKENEYPNYIETKEEANEALLNIDKMNILKNKRKELRQTLDNKFDKEVYMSVIANYNNGFYGMNETKLKEELYNKTGIKINLLYMIVKNNDHYNNEVTALDILINASTEEVSDSEMKRLAYETGYNLNKQFLARNEINPIDDLYDKIPEQLNVLCLKKEDKSRY